MNVPTDATSLSRVSAATEASLVSLEPVYNQLYSLMLLYKAERMPGLGEWVEKTREAMPLELLHRNRLVMEGLCYAFTTEGNVPSFGAYLDHLSTLPAESFQDRILGCMRRPPSAAAP